MEVFSGCGRAGFTRVGRRWLRIACALVALIIGVGAVIPDAHGQSFLQQLMNFFTPPATPAETVGAHLHGAPIPNGPDAPLGKSDQEICTQWANRAIGSHLPAQMDPATAAYAHDALGLLGYGPLKPGMIEQSRSFNLDTIADPGLLFLIGFPDSGNPHGIAALKKAMDGMPASTYPKFISFMAVANYAKALCDSGTLATQLGSYDDLALQYLGQGLADGSFQPGEMIALRCRLGAPSTENMLARAGDRLAQVVASSSNVAPWLAEYIQGTQSINDAWRSRGSGWANTVTDSGWKGFEANVAIARQHLVKSWQLNPHDPAAAADMITVCMAENEDKETMRTWFDRAVAAQMDYMSAYTQLRWGLRPRWLGNFAEMLAFGRECAATGRYDTMVPYQLISTAFDMSEDSKDPAAPFEDKGLDSEILTVIDNYFKTPNPPIPVRNARTIGAIMAHKLGRMDEVKTHLAAINYLPVYKGFYPQLDDLPALVTQAKSTNP